MKKKEKKRKKRNANSVINRVGFKERLIGGSDMFKWWKLQIKRT